MATLWSNSAAGIAAAGPDLHLDLDISNRRRSLEVTLRDGIRSGRLAPGTRLPATRVLARDLGIARGTVTGAYDQLVAEGYLTARQGSGTTVAAQPAAAQTASPVNSAAAAAPYGRAGRPGRPARPARWDFTPGTPDVSAFPRTAWLTSTKRVLASCPNEFFGYGDPRGALPLRRALAGYLGRARGVLTQPEHIVICAGYTHALTLLVAALRRDGVTQVEFEDPGLPQHRDLVRDLGMSVRGVQVDDEGVRVDEITAPAVVVTPAHQYPTGVTLAPARRARLVEWARTTGGLVIEDDYDGEFRYDRQPVGAVQGLAPDRVVYAGTASKALAPGLRLAWLAVPPRLAEVIADLRPPSDRHPGVIDQLVLADLIGSGGYDRQIRQGRLRYRGRRDRLVTELSRQAPTVHCRGIAAGLHVLLDLPADGPSEEAVLALAWRREVGVEGLASHWFDSADRPGGLVVGYARPAGHAFEPALAELTGLLADVTNSSSIRRG